MRVYWRLSQADRSSLVVAPLLVNPRILTFSTMTHGEPKYFIARLKRYPAIAGIVAISGMVIAAGAFFDGAGKAYRGLESVWNRVWRSDILPPSQLPDGPECRFVLIDPVFWRVGIDKTTQRPFQSERCASFRCAVIKFRRRWQTGPLLMLRSYDRHAVWVSFLLSILSAVGPRALTTQTLGSISTAQRPAVLALVLDNDGLAADEIVTQKPNTLHLRTDKNEGRRQ